jgi:hypothetical protein
MRGGIARRYQAMWTNEVVYIHQHSCMRAEPPLWVVYLELSAKTRVYMKGVAPISPQWLPELALSMCDRLGPVADPPPRYDAQKDDMLCVIAPIFGPRNWEIPPKVRLAPPLCPRHTRAPACTSASVPRFRGLTEGTRARVRRQ